MKTNPAFPNLRIVDHPIVLDRLSKMRMMQTPTRDFRTLLYEITLLMGYEVTRDFATENKAIETPVTKTEAPFLVEDAPIIIPILRAGLGMTDGLVTLLPKAVIGHIGVARDKNHRPVEYLVKLPTIGDKHVIVVDPMLATGNSAAHTLDVLKRHGVKGSQMRFLSVLAAPEGVQTLQEKHPDVAIYTASLDERLNEKASIVPGLGDAGDRLFGTL